MTWEVSRSRWRKLYKGKLYWVSTRALKAPPTKEGSYQAANAWWAQKRAELDGYKPPTQHEGVVQILQERLAWAQAHHQGKLADSLKETISLLETADDLHPSIASEFLGGLETYRRWSQRTQQAPDTVIDNNTIGHHVARWLENMRARAQLGQISPDRYDNVRDQIARFENFVGMELPVAAINEDVYEKYFLDLAGWARSPVTADGHLRVVKQFLHYLYGKRLIELPRNLKARQLHFKLTAKEIQVFSVEQVKELIAKSKGQSKLHILLGLNCGMGASDISELKQAEIDWRRGVITRKRGKTSDKDNVPTVQYKLWGETFALLKQFNTGNDPVLTTRRGGEWAFRRLRADGTLWRNDNVAPLFRRVLKACKLLGKGLSHYNLRKTSATLLESHSEYGRYVTYFLGHSPKGTAAKHYAAPSTELFDAAVTWLGRQYGL